MREMVDSDEHRHVPTGRLAILAQRLGKVYASATTWWRMVRKRGWCRPRRRVYPAKPKLRVRASQPDELWHVAYLEWQPLFSAGAAPHHVAPPRLSETCFALLTAGYIPVITHPERLSWIEDHYALFQELAGRGVWMQLTAGSLTGRFGHKARYWAERMLDEGIVHLLATDAHGVRSRPPLLAEGRQAAERWVGPQQRGRLR